MAYKKLLFRSEARETLPKGSGALPDAVCIPIGSGSKSGLIQKSFVAQIIRDDWGPIAKALRIKKRAEDMRARLLQQGAERTGDALGDGTMASASIANPLFSKGVCNVAADAAGKKIRRGFKEPLNSAVTALREVSRPAQHRKEKSQIASTAAHCDQMIGELVADAMEKVGDDGAIVVEAPRTTEKVLELAEGLQFDRGNFSPYFVIDSKALTAQLENPAILLHERKPGRLRPLVPLLESAMQAGRALLIVAEDLDDEGIAALTGCCRVSPDLGVDGESTTIVGEAGDLVEIEARIAQLKLQIAECTPDHGSEKLSKHLAKLPGSVAVTRAGAATETELKSRKEALDTYA